MSDLSAAVSAYNPDCVSADSIIHRLQEDDARTGVPLSRYSNNQRPMTDEASEYDD